MKELTEFWVDQTRDAAAMWDSWKDPHRGQVLQAIRLLDVGTVYEIGCGSGPNLRLLRDYFPKLYLAGSEPNKGLREHCQKYFPCDDLTLPVVSMKSYDCVLSMYTLAYVADAGVVLESLLDAGNKHLILIEPTAGFYPFEKPGLYNGHAMTSYAHDYKELAQEAGWNIEWRWPIVPHYQGLNCVLILTR